MRTNINFIVGYCLIGLMAAHFWIGKLKLERRSAEILTLLESKKNIGKQNTKARSFRADTWHVKAFYEIGMRVHL